MNRRCGALPRARPCDLRASRPETRPFPPTYRRLVHVRVRDRNFGPARSSIREWPSLDVDRKTMRARALEPIDEANDTALVVEISTGPPLWAVDHSRSQARSPPPASEPGERRIPRCNAAGELLDHRRTRRSRSDGFFTTVCLYD